MNSDIAVPVRSCLIKPNWNTDDFLPRRGDDGSSSSLGSSVAGGDKSFKEKTVEDLKYTFIRNKVAPILDKETTNSSHKENNVFGLAELLNFQEDDITYLRNCYAGGGNPAGNFIKTLVQDFPDTPVSELRACLMKEGLPSKKALESIGNYNDNDILKKIRPLDLHNLGMKLTTHGKTKHDWRFVAECFGFDERIPLFEASIRRNNITSPTMAFMELVKTKMPKTSLQQLINCLEMLENFEAANLLKNYLQ